MISRRANAAVADSADKDSLSKALDHVRQPGRGAHFECNPGGTAADQRQALADLIAPCRAPRVRFEIIALMSRLYVGGFRPGEPFLPADPEKQLEAVGVRIGAPGRVGHIRITVTRAAG